MNILVGILKLILSLACFLLGLAMFFVAGDGYPILIMLLTLLMSFISINNGVYLIKRSISNFKRKTIKTNFYNKLSIVLILLSMLLLIIFPIIMFDFKKDLEMVIQGILLGVFLGLIGIFDLIKVIKLSKVK